MGAGSLRALVTLLVMGVFAWFTLRGILGISRAALDAVAVTLPTTQDIPSLLGSAASRRRHLLPWSALRGRLALAGREFRADKWNWLGGLVVGLMVVAGWYVSGRIGFVAEHPETLGRRRGSAPTPDARNR